MLPRIKRDDYDSHWHIDPTVTTLIKFYQTDQNANFEKEFHSKEKLFHTLSFVYVIQ